MNPLWRAGWLVGPECVWVIRLPRGGRTPSELYTWSALPHLTMPHAVVLRESTKQLLGWISPTEQLALTDFLADSNYSPTILPSAHCILPSTIVHIACYHLQLYTLHTGVFSPCTAASTMNTVLASGKPSPVMALTLGLYLNSHI